MEHVSFQKYALELLERLSGKTKQTNNDFSLVNIHKANVVAQTKIQFNDRQLLQLIYQHLMSKGLVDSATLLQREANLSLLTNSTHLPSKFRYATPVTPNRVCNSLILTWCSFTFLLFFLQTRHSSTSSSYHKNPSNYDSPPNNGNVQTCTSTIVNGVPPVTQTIKLIK